MREDGGRDGKDRLTVIGMASTPQATSGMKTFAPAAWNETTNTSFCRSTFVAPG